MIRPEEVYQVGLINKPHGVRGEVSVTLYDDAFDRIDVSCIVCMMDGILVPFFVEGYRFRSDTSALVKIEDVDTLQQAKLFTNVEVYLPKKYAGEMEPDELGWNFFVGFRVRDTQAGDLGHIVRVDDSTVNTLFVVETGERERLIPAQESLIADIDMDGEQITMNLPEGLLEL